MNSSSLLDVRIATNIWWADWVRTAKYILPVCLSAFLPTWQTTIKIVGGHWLDWDQYRYHIFTPDRILRPLLSTSLMGHHLFQCVQCLQFNLNPIFKYSHQTQLNSIQFNAILWQSFQFIGLQFARLVVRSIPQSWVFLPILFNLNLNLNLKLHYWWTTFKMASLNFSLFVYFWYSLRIFLYMFFDVLLSTFLCNVSVRGAFCLIILFFFYKNCYFNRKMYSPIKNQDNICLITFNKKSWALLFSLKTI